MATVASLVFEMSANIARLQSDMGKARATVESATNGIKSAVDSAKVALGVLGITASAGAFVSFVKGAIDAEAALYNLSKRTGESVEVLSALKGVAKASQTDMEAVAAGVQKLDKAMLETATTGGGKAAPAFAALGIEVKDANGHLRASDQVMKEVADKLATMENRTQAVAYAQLILGKAGANLLPFLDELAKTGELHAKVTTEQAEQAEKFEQSLAKLEGRTKKLGIAIANELLPTMNKLLDVMQGGGDKKVEVSWFDKTFASMSMKAKEYIISMESATAATLRFFGADKGANFHQQEADRLQKQVDAMKKQAIDAEIAAYRAGERVKGKGAGISVPLSQEEAASGAAKQAPEDDWKVKALLARERAWQAEADAATRAYEAERQAAEEAQRRWQDVLDTAAMARAKQMAELDDADTVHLDKLEKMVKKTEQTNDIARQLGMTFTSAFEDAAVKGKSFRDVLSGIEQDIARIILRKAIVEPAGEAIGGLFKDSGIGSGIGDFLKGIFGGARASGGAVSAGSAYLVGENGPELFMPGNSGGIVPNDALGGAPNFNITMNIQALDSRSVAQAIAPLKAQIVGMVNDAANSRFRRGPLGV
jgi:hypothetical protein